MSTVPVSRVNFSLSAMVSLAEASVALVVVVVVVSTADALVLVAMLTAPSNSPDIILSICAIGRTLVDATSGMGNDTESMYALWWWGVMHHQPRS